MGKKHGKNGVEWRESKRRCVEPFVSIARAIEYGSCRERSNMRLAESQIKVGILHAEEEVRLQAVGYWADCHGRDETIMPLVIQAVERYGRSSAFRMLRDAERLVQTAPTVAWLMDELRRDYDQEDIRQDNYRFAVGLALAYADPELLVRRHKGFLALPAFPEQLQSVLDDRLRFHLMGWPALWAELERFGQEVMARDEVTFADERYGHNLIEAMGRHVREGDKVVRAMAGKGHRSKRALMDWLAPEMVELAGRMRLNKAIPRIIRKISEGSAAVLDRSGAALGRIGTDVVVAEITHSWRASDTDERMVFCEAMETVHTDRCVRRCLEFLEEEEDFDLALWLGGVLLSHFCAEGIEETRQLVLEDDQEELTPEQRDLKFRLVAVATIMGTGFPEYDGWHAEAIAMNYGWGDYEPQRMSRYF